MTYYAEPAVGKGWVVTKYLGLTKSNYPTLAMAKEVCDMLGVTLIVLSADGERMN